MSRYKIDKATKALWALEAAQDKFNEAVENLSEEDFQVFLKKNDLKLEPSKTKERIRDALEKPTKESHESTVDEIKRYRSEYAEQGNE